MLLTREPSPLERTHRLRVILGLGSAPIRDRGCASASACSDVLECFGSTDAGVVTIEPLGVAAAPGLVRPAGARRPGAASSTTPAPRCPPRAVGEIAVDSPARMAAYFSDPEETARALRDGWFLTGDLGYLDEDGWLYFVDRKRDVIRRGGENVSSVLVEKTLREHPAVAEVGGDRRARPGARAGDQGVRGGERAR